MSLAKLRHQDHYIAVTKELRDAGFNWQEEFGGKHPRLVIDVDGREETEIISLSPSDWRSTRQAVAHIRRRIRQWRSAATVGSDTAVADLFPTLEKETMDDTAIEIAVHVVDRERRVIDIDLGIGLGYGRPERIRDVIKRNIDEFEALGDLPQVRQNPGKAGRPTSAYYLNEHQALLAAAKSEAPNAKEARRRIIAAFVASQRSPVVPAVASDDVQALLEMLADIRTAIIASQQNGSAIALEHIDGAKAAVLHYLKAYLKEPATAFYEDVRTRNVATYERDRRLIEGIESLTRTVSAMLSRAAPTINDRPFIWTEWYDCDRLYSEWFPERHIPRRGLLSGVVSRALDRHCKTTRKFHHMEHRIVGGKGVNWWHKDSVFAWLEAGGRNLIATHLDRYSQEPRRPILALVN